MADVVIPKVYIKAKKKNGEFEFCFDLDDATETGTDDATETGTDNTPGEWKEEKR